MKRKCSGTRGYNCGRSCISVKFVCRRDGLTGQSVDIANKLASMIRSVSNSLFPDPNSLGDLPPLPPLPAEFKPTRPRNLEPKSTKAKSLDVSKVKPLDNSKKSAAKATDIAANLRASGYNSKIAVKGSKIMLPGNGIIDVNDDGSISTYKLSDRIKPVIDALKKPKIKVNRGEILDIGNTKAIQSEVNEYKTRVFAKPEVSEGVTELSFNVNGSLDAINISDESVKRRIAAVVRSDINKILDSMPDGSKYQAEPYDGDGKGSKRATLYEKFGFSKPDSRNQMFAIKENGKLRPPTEDELIFEFAEDNELEQLLYEVLFV